ncbi:MAG: hypothetical protein SPF98_07165 [Campylobacter sp.]|nr:hypothetical protein [Campylobacter sp.]
MQNKAYIIEIATYKKGKLTDESGFIPQCYMSKDLVVKAVRQKSIKIRDSLPKALKPRIQISYSNEAIFKGKVRVYFKGGYTEIKPFELDIIQDEVNGD